ncbi:MAG: hypothetical protein CMH55_07950 [Myxococcales bacterium]|nr:hypothetical protein [Myxococcales bacterium]
MPRVRLQPGRVEVGLAQAVALSRRVAVTWLREGRVQLDGRRLRKGERLPGEVEVSLSLDGALGQWIPPADSPLPLLASGAGWLSVNKPAGVHSHLHMPFEQGTALNSLVAHQEHVAQTGDDPLQGGLVHRLDRDASGVLLAACDQAVWRDLRRAFAAGEVERIYRARVDGQPRASACEAPLLAAGDHVRVGDGGRPCRTRWQPLDDAGLLEVELLTGHRHQIRVHLAHMGSPIEGDSMYHPDGEGPLKLHCHRLRWAGGEVVAAPPPDLEPR